MAANTGITTVVQQPVTEPVTFKIRQPLKRSSVKSTAIVQIVFATFCIILGFWIAATNITNERRRNAGISLVTLSIWLYIPSGAVGLRAASNNNICAVVAYQTMSLFGCITSVSQSLYFFIQIFVPRKLVSDIFTFICTLAVCIAAGRGTSIVQKSTGCCCAKYPAQTEPVCQLLQ
ncbi:uncharacterized protein LOC117118548 [Anneissia japonica]|uniref:uncharacterized protein LOC117118548 n=1 Tax=Anneissia japonica TaxID=1529436 RepID=UPI0014259B64|nr:uncharacterized protein LOC117118548 [Anneissia japonica]